MSARGSRSRGASLLESTLVLLFLLVLLYGLFDFSFGLYMRHTLMHNARIALRWGVVRPYDATGITNMFLYSTPNPGRDAKGVLGLTPANVAVQPLDAGTISARLVLTISKYRYPILTPGFAHIATGLPIVLSQPIEP